MKGDPLSSRCVVGSRDCSQIVEENLFYDLVGLMQQVGIDG
jgi:hypothetical protein